jgi:hypothetical protein
MNVIKDIVSYLGYAVMMTGLAHFALGVVIMWPTVNEILKQGVFGVVQPGDSSKMTFLWFEAAGLGLFVGGIALHNMLQSGIGTVPWLFAISFLLTAIFVWVLFPRGGAWFFLAEAVLLTMAKAWL